MVFRTLTQLAATLVNRGRFAMDGFTFGGRRDMYQVLGYKRAVFANDYRARFRRNEVANRIVKALPKATWRGGAEVAEDQDIENDTAFEEEFRALDNRLNVWETFRKADILSGIGRYAIILIGAPGAMDTPLEECSLDDIAYLTPYAEEDAGIQLFDIDEKSARFGLPVFYLLKRGINNSNGTALNNIAGIGKRVHYSRCIHIADGLLDDSIYGEPRLQCVWNRLDDLEKIAGGGAEAFWKRADQGKQFDLDPTMDLSTEQVAEMEEQINAFNNEGKRTLRTRGMKINEFGSDVADFKSQVESIIGLISAGCGIPQRVLMGSEQGRMAAKQDRASWDQQVTDRQKDYAGPCIVRPFVNRLVELGALTAPAKGFTVTWSTIQTMDDEQRATIAKDWVGSMSVTRNEVRTRVLGLPPLPDGDARGDEILIATKGGTPTDTGGGSPVPGGPTKTAQSDPMVAVLELALSHGQFHLVDHLLGFKTASTPAEAAVVVKEIHTIEKSNPEVLDLILAALNRVPTINVPAPIINVAAPNVSVPAPIVNVAAPNVTVEAAPAPVVNVAAPHVHVEPPNVHVAAAAAPVINVAAPHVNVAAPNVNVEAVKTKRVLKKVHRDANNLITSIETEE